MVSEDTPEGDKDRRTDALVAIRNTADKDLDIVNSASNEVGLDMPLAISISRILNEWQIKLHQAITEETSKTAALLKSKLIEEHQFVVEPKPIVFREFGFETLKRNGVEIVIRTYAFLSIGVGITLPPDAPIENPIKAENASGFSIGYTNEPRKVFIRKKQDFVLNDRSDVEKTIPLINDCVCQIKRIADEVSSKSG